MKPGLLDVSALIQEATDLAPLPASTIRLARLVADEDTELRTISDTVRLDEALTGRVLGAANSARSGPRAEVATVEEAVIRMGTGMVLSIALASSVGATMRRPLPGYGLSEGALWRHSVAAALAVERSGRYCRSVLYPEAFAAALLHDVGKLVLSRYLDPELGERLKELQETRRLSADDAEQQVLGIGHAELGARVARNWELPDTIVLAILHHHSPLDAPSEQGRGLCSRIQLADAVASEVQAACEGDDSRTGFSPHLAGSLGITSEGFANLCADVERMLEEVLGTYEVR